MRGIKITPDLIIAAGMSIALIVAVSLGRSPEITGVIAGGLAGYLGQVVSNDDSRKRATEERRMSDAKSENR